MIISLKVIIFVLLCVTVVHSRYSVHYVENRCQRGNESIVYRLDSTDSLAVILRPVKYGSYSPNRNCSIILQPPTGYGVVLAVRKIDFIRSVLTFDYLKVYHSALSSPSILYKFKFDLYERLAYYSSGPMSLLYHTESRSNGRYLEIGFEVTATAFIADSVECEGKFHCDNKKCIKEDLTCDGHNNCGDSSDESRLTCDKFPVIPDLPGRYVVIISICVLLFLFVLSCTIFCCVKSRNPSDTPDLSSDQSTTPSCSTPYEAVHPSGYFICQNPAGPSTLYPPPHPSVIQHEGGFTNPCYPIGVPQHPPPPYKP